MKIPCDDGVLSGPTTEVNRNDPQFKRVLLGISGAWFPEMLPITELGIRKNFLLFQVHGSLEIFGLLVLSIELGIRMKWLGVKVYVHHMRTMIKVSVIMC